MMGDESLALGVDRLKFDELKTDRMMKEGAVLDELKEKLSFREPTPATDDLPKEPKPEPLETVDESDPNKENDLKQDDFKVTPRSVSISEKEDTKSGKPTPRGELSDIEVKSGKPTPRSELSDIEVKSGKPTPRAMSPANSYVRSEYSGAGFPTPRNADDEPIAPSTPRSNASGRLTPNGRNTPTNKQQSAVAARIAAASAGANNKEAAPSQVKKLASSLTTDTTAQQEKQRKLEQLRGGSFKTASKKWTPPGANKVKIAEDAKSVDKNENKEAAQEDCNSVSAMKKNWELGKSKNASSNGKDAAPKKDDDKKEGGFGDLMKRFKVIEGSEKSEVQKTKETRQGISSKAAMFETSVKKPSSKKLGVKPGAPKLGDAEEPRSNSIKGRAAMFEKK
eukprot:TRINITY_DN12014_c0_g1_i4.p1 TRINITY_DN12014_c0_g1~~TRINITY_DN12014_c0_g1_i4.p1  ORF type:complete len:447 (+),score=97.12 TRINITY_DN12014_c0_g1_i4:160-1341(+)